MRRCETRWMLLALVLVIALAGCAGMQVKDPVKAGFYTVKEEWLAVREHVIREHEAGRLSDHEYNIFRVKDDQFSLAYNLAKDAYVTLSGGGNDLGIYNTQMKTLRDMLLEARRKYYPVGG